MLATCFCRNLDCDGFKEFTFIICSIYCMYLLLKNLKFLLFSELSFFRLHAAVDKQLPNPFLFFNHPETILFNIKFSLNER